GVAAAAAAPPPPQPLLQGHATPRAPLLAKEALAAPRSRSTRAMARRAGSPPPSPTGLRPRPALRRPTPVAVAHGVCLVRPESPTPVLAIAGRPAANIAGHAPAALLRSQRRSRASRAH